MSACNECGAPRNWTQLFDQAEDEITELNNQIESAEAEVRRLENQVGDLEVENNQLKEAVEHLGNMAWDVSKEADKYV